MKKTAAAQAFYRERIQPTVLLNGWLGWWDMAIESCLKEGRKRRVLQAEGRKEFFRQRILPDILLDGWSVWWNIMEKEGKRVVLRKRITDDDTTGFHLVGWRGWWSRMDAEGKREAATMSKLELLNIQNANNRASSIKRFFLNNKEAENIKQANTQISTSFPNNIAHTTLNLRKDPQNVQSILNDRIFGSPKLKFSQNNNIGLQSPAKKMKNSSEARIFWEGLAKQSTGDTASKSYISRR